MSSKRLYSLIAAVVLVLPLSLFAKDSNEGKVDLATAVTVGTTQLQPGSYKVEWSGNGPQVQVSFIQHSKTVATTEGKVIDHPQPASQSDVVLKPVAGNSGAMTIDQIDFNHRNQSLQIVSN